MNQSPKEVEELINQIFQDFLLDELIEASMITGKPGHELLGITKEQYDEWLNKCESRRKPMTRLLFPSFDEEEK